VHEVVISRHRRSYVKEDFVFMTTITLEAPESGK
jgi:hypothetical protein